MEESGIKLKETTTNNPIKSIGLKTWPDEIPSKNNFTKLEKDIISLFKRYISSGWLAIGLDPVGLSNEHTKMGLLITEHSGILTFSINTSVCFEDFKNIAKEYNNMIAEKITELLSDSPALIEIVNGKKFLKYPYRHISLLDTETENDDIFSVKVFKDSKFIKTLLSQDYKKFTITYTEALCVMDRLAPEYTVIKKEKNVETNQIDAKSNENDNIASI